MIDPVASAIDQIIEKVQAVVDDPQSFGVLSTGEKLAVALVLDRPDLLKWWGTMLEAVARLGPEWTAAAIRVQREGRISESAHRIKWQAPE